MKNKLDYQKQLLNLLESFDYHENMDRKFKEMCNVIAYSLASVHNFHIHEEIKKLLSNIPESTLHIYEKCLDVIVNALQEEYQDFLGSFFEQNEMFNKHKGQFFTPYHISLLSAKMAFSPDSIKRKGIMKINEPSGGSGGMVIAFAQTVLENNYNPSADIFAELWDIDELCFFMAYIQISLLGIPARIIWGNTLELRPFQVLYTPVYFLNNIQKKLDSIEMLEKMQSALKLIDGVDDEKASKPVSVDTIPPNAKFSKGMMVVYAKENGNNLIGGIADIGFDEKGIFYNIAINAKENTIIYEDKIIQIITDIPCECLHLSQENLTIKEKRPIPVEPIIEDDQETVIPIFDFMEVS